MTAYKAWLVSCKSCSPWTRVVPHKTTHEPIVEALHEEGCAVFPHQQRIDGQTIT